MRDWSRWYWPEQINIPAKVRHWLVDQGSLTRRLQTISHHGFSVDWLGSHWQKPLVEERRWLSLPLEQLAYQRQVRLLDGDTALVFARTIVPLVTYLNNRRRFTALGNRPLGEMLFNDVAVQRGPIQVAQLRRDSTLFREASALDPVASASLWARRSCFYLQGEPLLVNEIFLPALWSVVE
ncbi:MAG: chorismate lyase [Methylophaga sp.]|nr:chorismate lyase [Methylophaga sp.]